MVTGVPSALAVIDTLQRMGRDLTREKFVDAMEKLNLTADVMTGPLQFSPGRRDALRSVVVVKFDGKTQKAMPDIYTWNGKDGN
jgi:hypothetical protein